jgi:hypothetical protein
MDHFGMGSSAFKKGFYFKIIFYEQIDPLDTFLFTRLGRASTAKTDHRGFLNHFKDRLAGKINFYSFSPFLFLG